MPQPHRPQQVIHHAHGHSQQNCQKKAAELLRDLNFHGSAEQAAEKAPLTVRRILVGDGVDASVHEQFAAL